MKGFNNAMCYVEGVGLSRTSLCFEELIHAIDYDITTPMDLIEIKDDWLVLPGFIDQHIHGAAGFDTMDGTEEALLKISEAIAKEGVTSFCPTTMTQSKGSILKALKNVRSFLAKKHPRGAEVIGVHLEGPFLAYDYSGAQPPQYLQKPSIELFNEFQAASGNHIVILTLAPELPGSEILIPYLKEHHVVASIGHTASRLNVVQEAVSLGATNLTHAYNAMRPFHHREIGTVGAAFLFDDLICELICDNIHVSIPAMQFLIKLKTKDRVILISDAIRAKGLPEGISELGGQKVIVKNGAARLEDGTLAGSILKTNIALKNICELVGVPLEDAVDMMTINPARNLKIDHLVGSIQVGKRANFAILDSNFNVMMTIRDGEIIYQNKQINNERIEEVA